MFANMVLEEKKCYWYRLNKTFQRNDFEEACLEDIVSSSYPSIYLFLYHLSFRDPINTLSENFFSITAEANMLIHAMKINGALVLAAL